MSEENQVVEAEVVSDVVSNDASLAQVEAPVEQSIEDQAKEKGWNPDYTGSNKVSAEEFMRVGSMIGRQKYLERQLDLISKQNQDMFKKFQDAEITGYKRAVEELKIQRREAVELGDVNRVDSITQQMDEYKQTIATEEQKAKQNAVPIEAMDFINRNSSWFGKDQRLTNLAMIKEKEYEILHPDKSRVEVLQMVEDSMNVVRGVRKETPRPVAAPSRNAIPGGSNASVNDLSKDERDMYKAIHTSLRGKDQKDFTVDKYIDQLKQLGVRH